MIQQTDKQFSRLKQAILVLLKRVENTLFSNEQKIDSKTILLFSKLIDNFIKIVSIESKLRLAESVNQEQISVQDKEILQSFKIKHSSTNNLLE